MQKIFYPLLILIFISLLGYSSEKSGFYNVLDYGVLGVGETINTTAIQNAIEGIK